MIQGSIILVLPREEALGLKSSKPFMIDLCSTKLCRNLNNVIRCFANSLVVWAVEVLCFILLDFIAFNSKFTFYPNSGFVFFQGKTSTSFSSILLRSL